MKRKFINLGILVSFLTFALGLGSFAEEKHANILFTHDLHSHLDEVQVQYGEIYHTDEERTSNTISDDTIVNVGGISRIASLIKQEKRNFPSTFVLDGGDMAIGTLYQALYETDAVELRVLGKLGYDATTLGNHDFDLGMQGLANMFKAAANSGEHLPDYILSNVNWDVNSSSVDKVYKAVKQCNFKEYSVFTKGNIKAAVFGIFGKDAIDCSPLSELEFKDQIETAKEIVKEIKEKENPDLIICLSHSGTNEDPEKSEDELLAKAVPEIDVIVSAHTHTVLEIPIKINDTYIVSCGCNCTNLGKIELVQNSTLRWDLKNYKIFPINETINKDREIENYLITFKEKINKKYKSLGYEVDGVVAISKQNFEHRDDLENIHTEHCLGNLISDSYIYSANQLEECATDPVEIAIAPIGTIRTTYNQGPITLSQVFESFSMGNGKDDVVGYPLLSVYLTGEELYDLCEIDASVSSLMEGTKLYTSGLGFTYNTNRIILNRIEEAHLLGGVMDDTSYPIQKDKLYRVVTDMYSGLILAKVKEISKGLLSIEPKTKDGLIITDLQDAVLHYDNGNELKGWTAIATYMSSFEKNSEGISVIPDYYYVKHGRKIVSNSLSPIKLLKNPSKTGKIIYTVIIFLITFIILVIGVIKRKIKSKITEAKVKNGKVNTKTEKSTIKKQTKEVKKEINIQSFTNKTQSKEEQEKEAQLQAELDFFKK